MKKIYEIDGKDFVNLEDFFQIISHTLIPGAFWGKNLDAFNDILRGGFGTPDEGFIIRWNNSELSREKLGYTETLKWLKQKLEHCHPANREFVKQEILEAENQQGQTLFDILVEIIKDHGPRGGEAEDRVDLELI